VTDNRQYPQSAENGCGVKGGGYTHWRCQRPRFHRGPHRFNNYTWGRLPRVWRVHHLVRWALIWLKWVRRYGLRPETKPRIPWRKVLWPADYRPIQSRPHFDRNEP
jgi:hypothetical protein